MNQKVLWGSFAAAFLLAGCFPPLTGAPCSSNDNCPTGQVCGSDGLCVRGEGGGTGGGGDGGGTGGGAMGGGGGDDGGMGGGTGGGDDGGVGGGGGDDGGTGGGTGGGDDGGVGGGGGDDGGTGGGGGDLDAGVAMIAVDRAMVDFGDVTVNGMSGNEVVTISNTGDLATGTLAVTVTGAQSAAFQIGSTTCSGALGPMSSCQIVLTFLPTTAGVANAALEVSGAPGGMVSTALTGQGRFPAALSLMPTTRSFGTVVLGSTSMPQTFTVTNTGGSPTGVPAPTITGLDGSLFTITGSTCTGALAPAGTCQVTVVFVPTTSGSKSATLEVSATPGDTAMSTLAGIAQTPAALSGMPSPGAFGFAVVGSTTGTNTTFTITNQGEATTPSLTTAIGGANAGDFIKGTDTCQGQTVLGGASCTVAVRFQPSASGARAGTLSVSGPGITPAVISLGGTGQTPATLVLSTMAQDFGSVATNSSATATIGVSNTGEVATGSPSFSTGGSTEFTVTGNTCGMSIAPGGSCSASLRFGPSVVGSRSATFTASATPGGMATASLTGTGVAPGALAITPVTRDFGGVLIGQSGGVQDFTVSNTGGTSLTGVTVTVGGAAASSFSKSNDTCMGATLPGAGSCSFRINFVPQGPGPLSGYVQVAASGGNTTQATLSGTGLRPAALSIAPMSQAWPDTLVGAPGTTMTFTVTNDGDVATGTLSTNLTGPDAAHFGFKAGANLCAGTLAGQASCTIGVLFTPTTGGAKQATLAVTATPGGMASSSLSGNALTPAALTLAPATGSSANYGNVLLGDLKTMSFTVTNTGQQASGALGLTMTGTDAAMFQISTGSGACQLGQPLAGGASCTSAVRFTAGSAYGNGPKTAVLTASASPGSSPALTLTANVQNPANLVGSTTIKDLGGIEVGQPSSAYVWNVRNTGDVPTGTLSLTNTNATEFQVTANTCTGTLGAGATCSVTLIFKPTAGGNRSGTVTVSGSPGGSAAVAFSGKGQWRLTLVASGSGTGSLATTDGRMTNCTASTPCSALYDTVSVTVQARTVNGADSHFMIWESPTVCAPIGVGRDCSFTVSQSMTAKATFGSNAGYNLAFTSSTTEPANRGGVAPYDARCNALATAAGINNAAGNDYVAWMSDSASNAVARLPNNGGWRRLDGSVFAVSRTSLTSSLGGVVLTQLDLDERGVRIPNLTASAWTGTSKTGTYVAANACSNWTSVAASPSFDRGRTAGGPGLWTEGTGGHTCNNTGTHIYCL